LGEGLAQVFVALQGADGIVRVAMPSGWHIAIA
jgi:hypothetical protein